jgi:uncharacterized protein (TIGR03118 family)
MAISSGFRKKKAAPGRQLRHRLVLECLEDRCLLSGGFGLMNLASDVPGWARFTDPNLVNPWGIAFSPTGPLWFADNGRGVATILDGSGEPFAPVLPVPSAAHRGGVPTGTAFNGGGGFVISENGVSAPSRFLFVTLDGTISGWSAVVDPDRSLLAVDNSSSGAVYTGLALATDSTGHSFLYVADFSHGAVDVFDQGFRPVTRPGAFQDPGLPAGYAPFNVRDINNLLFVTYAKQGANWRDDVPGAGHGFIDVYNSDGSLVRRLASGGALNSPWGLALAPRDFGPFGGALLVGNNGDGHVSAFDPGSGAFLGQLADDKGIPMAIPGLWALTFGNDHVGGDSQTLFFAAGVGNESHGLLGAIQSPERRGWDTAGKGTFDPNAPGEPGDYPLPPRNGPAFRVSSEDRPIAVADLLPLRESSLVLLPTLSSISQAGTEVKPAGTGGPSRGLLAPSVDEHFSSAEAARGDALALNTFLDLSGWHGGSATADGQRLVNGRAILVARDLPAADFAAEVAVPASEVHTAKGRTPSGEDQGPQGQALSAPAVEVLAIGSWETSPGPVQEPAVSTWPDDSPQGGVWTKWLNGLLLLSIPVLWTCWPQAAEALSRASLPGRRKEGTQLAE